MARPLVAGRAAGETPGSTDTGDLVLTLLWFLVGIGAATYLAVAGAPLRRLGVVEAALAVFAALTVASVTQATYLRPAWVLVADAGAVLLAFWLIRQLAWSAADNFLVVHALLASGAALAADSLARLALPNAPPAVDPILADLFALEPRPDQPVQHRAVLAAYLALFLPVLVVVLVGMSRRRPVTVLLPGVLFALGTAAAVFSGLKSLAIGLTAAAAVGASYLAMLATPRRFAWAVGAFAFAATFLALLFVGPSPTGPRGATDALLREHVALGVGPGNFLHAVARYDPPPPAPLTTAAPTAAAAVRAASGNFALVCLVVAVGVVVFACGARLRRDEESTSRAGTPWEGYVGGALGLAIGFSLRPTEPGDNWGMLAGLAVAQSFVWFASFALLDALPRSPRSLCAALGVAVAALAGLAVGQEGTPAMALLLAVTVAAGLNLAQGPDHAWREVPVAVRLLPALGLIAITAAFALKVFQPVVEAAAEVAEARRVYLVWSEQIAPRVGDRSQEPKAQLDAATKARLVLVTKVLRPLTRAVDADRENAAVWAERAYWDGEAARVLNDLKELGEPADQPKWKQDQIAYATRAANVGCPAAQKLDPRGPTGYHLAYRLRRQFAQEPTATIDERRTQCEEALRNLRRLGEVAPPGPLVPYWTAEMQFRYAQAIRQQMDDLPSGDTDDQRRAVEALRKEYRERAAQATADGEAAAAEARRLDDLARGTPRALSTADREHLDQWVKK